VTWRIKTLKREAEVHNRVRGSGDLLGIVALLNLINFNRWQRLIPLLDNLANLRCDAAHLALVNPAQMKLTGRSINLLNRNLALTAQIPINILAEIPKLVNQIRFFCALISAR